MITITKKITINVITMFSIYTSVAVLASDSHNLYKCGSVNISKPQSIQVRQSKPCIARNKQPLFYKIEFKKKTFQSYTLLIFLIHSIEIRWAIQTVHAIV